MEYSPNSHETLFDDPDVVAAFFGHESIEHMAQGIKRDARILMIGSGTADFAKTLGILRFDIDQTNISTDYADPVAMKQAQTNSPINLEFADTPFDQLSAKFTDTPFDAIYFYDKPVRHHDSSSVDLRRTATALLQITKPSGAIHIAPIKEGFEDLGLYDSSKEILVIAGGQTQPERVQPSTIETRPSRTFQLLKVAAALGIAAAITARVIPGSRNK